jgi:hypothetical protein
LATAFLVTVLVQALDLPRCALRRQSNPESKRWGLHFRLELGTVLHGHAAERCCNADADEGECD